mgnify:CR=1 FL=1
MELRMVTSESKELDTVIKLYKESFPPIEHRDIKSVFFDKTGIVSVFAFYETDSFCGFACTLQHLDICYILYLATVPSLRGKGIGSKILAQLHSHYLQKIIVLDIEEEDLKSENNNERIRRKRFYLRNGYQETHIINEWRGISFEVLSINEIISKKKYDDFWLYIEKNTCGLM